MTNDNGRYHEVLLEAVPAGCAHALDAGCGSGLLVRRLARRCVRVTGIDVDPAGLAAAKAAGIPSNAEFVAGDVMTYPFERESFDCITAVAALHHLPLERALARFRDLLRPGGTLAIVGLYRSVTARDHATDALAFVARRLVRVPSTSAGTMPIRAPAETLADIRAAAATELPGATIRRRFFFRYTLVWRKP